MKEKIVSPSLLSANFGNLSADIERINKSKAQWLHLDIMDGVFVPNITFGFPVIQYIKNLTAKPLDVHLMIVDPDRYIEDFKNCGSDILTVHIEACRHLHRTIQKIKSYGMKAGVSLNPHSPVSLLKDVISELDLVLIMSVNPGFGGQKFIENTYSKVKELTQLIIESKSNAIIEVDGGVDDSNAEKLSNHGVDAFVAGNYIFKSKDPEETANKLYKIINNL